MTLVIHYSTKVLVQPSHMGTLSPPALVLRALLFFISFLLFMMYRMWLPQQLVSTILVWIRGIGSL